MKRMIFTLVSLTIFSALPASGSMVRGTISDSATGAPIGNVKVIVAQLQGEREVIADSSITGSNGRYSITFSGLSGMGFSIRTIATEHYFQSSPIGAVGIDDTITKDITLKRIPTMVSAAPNHAASPRFTVRAAKSLFLSGVPTGAVLDIYSLNGRRLFKTVVPAGASEVMIPERIAAAGCFQASIRANGRLVCCRVLSR